MKRRVIAALALVPALALSACSAEELVASESAQSSEASPNLDADRVADVLDEVGAAVAAADEAQDANAAEGRIIGGAARVRAAQYAYAKASGDTIPVIDLSAQNVAVTNASAWPRAILNIRQASASELPVVEILLQDDARSDYALASWCRMLGGTSVTIPSIETGSAFVTDDSTGFVSTPADALSAYLDQLNAGKDSSEAFATDEFTAQYLDTVETLNASLEAAGSVTAKAERADYPMAGVVLQDGSALVAGTFTYTLTYSRTVAGSTMRLGGQTATLNSGDEDTVAGTATVTYVATVLLNIPSASQGGVSRVVGAERVIESVTMDDSTNPDA